MRYFLRLSEVNQSREEISLFFCCHILEQYILRFEVIVDDAIIPEKSDSESRPVDETHFGLQGKNVPIAGDIIVQRLHLAQFRVDLNGLSFIVEEPRNEQTPSRRNYLEHL